MKKRIIASFLLFVFLLGQAQFTYALSFMSASSNLNASVEKIADQSVALSSFSLDEANLDAMFASATENASAMNIDDVLALDVNSTQGKGEKNAAVAFILAWVLGGLGIHRAYMGTSAGVVIGYILTCGGLGIVALIDWIVLLIALVDGGDISKYVGSKKFFMW
jgi:TM2 domain-containing membrane protein YozV